MELQTLVVMGLVGLLVVGLAAWVLRELQMALGWLAQPGPAEPAWLQAQDVAQVHQELQSR